MNPVEQLRVDGIVCAGLRKRPFESLQDAAHRILRMGRRAGKRRRVAAHIVLGTIGQPWERMARAAAFLEQGGCS